MPAGHATRLAWKSASYLLARGHTVAGEMFNASKSSGCLQGVSFTPQPAEKINPIGSTVFANLDEKCVKTAAMAMHAVQE